MHNENSTVARIAGNILSGISKEFLTSNDAVYTRRSDWGFSVPMPVIVGAVKAARAIVVEVARAAAEENSKS